MEGPPRRPPHPLQPTSSDRALVRRKQHMSTPNPLVPQGSLLEQQAKSKSTFQVAAFIVGIHVVILGGLLFLGCKKEENQSGAASGGTDTLATPPPVTGDTNPAANPFAVPTNAVVAVPETNPVVPPPPPQFVAQEPVPAASGSEYAVAKGDMAVKIAKTHGLTLKQLQDANPGVDLAKLKVGQKIQVPAGGSTPAVHQSAQADNAAAGSTTSYTVKGGDNLSRLAKKFGTTVKAIRDANGMTSNEIKVGQKLKIPAKGATVAPVSEAVATPVAPPSVTPANPVVAPTTPK
jgi:LysM repeat protein